MRLVQISVPDDRLEGVVDVLKDRELKHTQTLEDDEFSDLALESTTVAYTAPEPFDSDSVRVSVTIARTTDETHPELPQTLDERITERTGREVTVRINYVDYETSDEAEADG